MGLRIVAMLCVVSLASGACLEGGLRGAMRLSDGEIVAQRCTSEEAICRLCVEWPRPKAPFRWQ